jgi:transcriptional antiterminator NusG
MTDNKRWYVVQVYAGYENIVKADLLKRIQEHNLQDFFGEVLVPSAKMKQFFSTSDALQDQQLFPGYMLIQMQLTPQTKRLVATTPRVLRFLGGQDPVPLSQREIERVLAQTKGEVIVSGEKHDFEVNKEVEIKEGPFAGFMGIIDSINEENEKLTVMVSIFGRMTPVELRFDQVKH